jgi:hypothetical protein
MSALALEDLAPEAAPKTEIDDYDRDSIHTLALAALPLNTKGLKRARLIKNVRLETRIELYRAAGAGSAQIDIDSVLDFFDGDRVLVDQDLRMLNNLAELKSFDPYSLRRGLRQIGVKLQDKEILSLSLRRQDR